MRKLLSSLVVLSLSACVDPRDPREAREAQESSVSAIEPCGTLDPRPHPVSVVVAPDDGDGRLLAMIEGAQHSVDVSIYQLSSDRVIGALKVAAMRGVRVRVIHDRREAYEPTVAALREAGVEVHTSSPDFEHMHQKTVAVDARVAFVFSGNLDGRAFVRGRNYGVIDDDADDVADLEALFEADWAGRAPDLRCTRLVVSPINARARILALVNEATTLLDVEAMYITDREVEAAIVAAHMRGVKVRVLLNDPSFDIGSVAALAARLTAKGIPTRRSGERFVHAKLLVADDEFAFVGSENFSRNALDRNREAGVIVSSADSDVARIVFTFATDWQSGLAFDPPVSDPSAPDQP